MGVMPGLRSDLIRLAHENPDLRPHLLPLIHEAAAVKVTDEDIKRIAEMTDLNDHNSSIEELAKIVKDKAAVKAMKAIKTLHDFYGHMPIELIKLRAAMLNDLLAKAKSALDPETYDKLHGAF